MAKKISSSDLFEQEDLFKGVRDSATKTLQVFNELQAELKATATSLKGELTANTQASTAQLKQFTAATEQANTLMKQSLEIDELKAKATKTQAQADKELIRLQALKNKEAEKDAKNAARAAQLAEKEGSAYSKLSAELNKARKAYKDLAVTNQENTAEGKALLETVTRLDKQLKAVDATVGQHQRNVGNYEGATRNLKKELRELTRELMNMETSDPRFQEMTQRAGELKDQIQDTQAVVKATAGSAMENFAGATAKAGQIGVAAFQGVEASMQLLGVENENVLEGMRRLQALAGLGDALKTLGGLGDTLTEIRAGFTAAASKTMQFISAQNSATSAIQAQNTAAAAGGGAFTKMGTAAKTALSGIRGGIAATGIGLLVVALGTVVAYWDDIKEAVSGVSEEQEKLNKKTDANLKASEEKVDALDKQESILKLQGKTERDILNLKIAALDTAIKNAEINVVNMEATKVAQVEAAKRNKSILEGIIMFLTIPLQTLLGTIDLISVGLKAIGAIDESLNLREQMTSGLAKLVFDPEETSKEGDAAIKAAKEKVTELRNNQAKFKLELRAMDQQSLKDSQAAADKGLKNDADNAEKEISIQRQLEDEKMKMREDSRKKDLDALALEYKRKLEDDKENLKDDKDKAVKLEQLRKQYQENIRAGIKEINDKWDKIDAEAEAKLVAEMVAADQRQYDAQKKLRDAETSLLKDGLEKDKALIENAYQDELWALQNQLDEKKITQEEYDKLTRLAYKKRNKDITDAELKAAQDQKEKEKKLNEERWQSTQQFAQQTTDFFKKQSEERIAQMDKEISAAEKQADYYRELAANGNISAKESLAEQERIIAESNRRKEREQKRQQRMELANTIYQTYAGHAAKDPETALMKTIKDASLLQAFISTLPMFYEGTEDTGKGGGVDGKGGFHAVLHPHERVIPKSLNDQIGSLSNEQLTRLAMEYNNGRLVGQDVAHSSMDLAVLVSKLDNLTEVIKQKPETNIELGQITQSAMEIVQSTRKGNTTVYNRFKVQK